MFGISEISGNSEITSGNLGNSEVFGISHSCATSPAPIISSAAFHKCCSIFSEASSFLLLTMELNS